MVQAQSYDDGRDNETTGNDIHQQITMSIDQRTHYDKHTSSAYVMRLSGFSCRFLIVAGEGRSRASVTRTGQALPDPRDDTPPGRAAAALPVGSGSAKRIVTSRSGWRGRLRLPAPRTRPVTAVFMRVLCSAASLM
jgi:hypothetical protein